MQVRFPVLAIAVSLLSACIVELPSGQLPPSLDDRQPVFTQGTSGRNPIIQSFTANPSNVTKGQPITFQVVASDPDRNPLQLNWAATDGTLSTNTGQVVSWLPPEKPGVYSVTVTVANGRGGFVTGTQNLTVQANGSAVIGGKPASPPVSETSPTPPELPPLPSPSPRPSVLPSLATIASPTPMASGAPAATPTPRPQISSVPRDRRTVLPLPGFNSHDLLPGPQLDLDRHINLRINSASGKTYAISLNRVGVVVSGYSTGTTWNAIPGLAHTPIVRAPGVYALMVADGEPNNYTFNRNVRVDDGAVAEVELVAHCLKLERANWPMPVDADEQVKPLDGALYVFRYDGQGIDLGTFNLP
ncbi:PKD domain protein [compost metagenome]